MRQWPGTRFSSARRASLRLWKEAAYHRADVLGDLLRRHLAAHPTDAAAHEAAAAAAYRAGHAHPFVERDGGVGEEATKALLDVLVLGLVALVVGELLERSLVSLVEEEELAIREHLVDELVDEVGPCGDGLPFIELV